MTFSPDRRQVLCGLAAAVALPGVLAACSSGSDAPPSVPVARIPVGGGTVVSGSNGPVVFVQPTPGTVRAFSAVCPHQGSTVDPPQGGLITCPNHLSQFDAATGDLRKGPATTGLTVLPVAVANGVATVT